MAAQQGFRVYVVGDSQAGGLRLVRNVKAADSSQALGVAVGLSTGIEIGLGDEIVDEDFKVVIVDLDALAAGAPEWARVDHEEVHLPRTRPEHLPEDPADDTIEDAEERRLYQIGGLIRDVEAGIRA